MVNNGNDDRLEQTSRLVKSLPRIGLRYETEERILDQLRSSYNSMKLRNLRGKIGQRLSLALIAIALLFTIPFLWDNVRDQGWLSFITPAEEPWEVSPAFDLLDKDGSLIYAKRVIGIEGKIGFLEASDFAAKAPEPGAKMFWYVWGNPEELLGKQLVATAVHQQTGETFILNKTKLDHAIYGTDACALTSFNPFPLKGLWRIDVKIDDKKYGSIVVHVKDEYVHTDSVRFVHLSMDDLVEGIYLEAHLDGTGIKSNERVEVRAFPLKDKNDVHTFYFYDEWGRLYFDQPGKWQIEVLGESTIVDILAKEVSWELSPVFPILNAVGTIKYPRFRGIEGKFAFPDAEYIANASEPSSRMLGLIWGDVKRFWGKDMVAIGTHQQTGRSTTLFQEKVREPWQGVDTHILTSFAFPLHGIWRMDLYIDGEAYGSIVVTVKNQYVTTRLAKFLISQDDLYVNTTFGNLEVYGEHKDKEIQITATYLEDRTDIRKFTYRNSGYYLKANEGGEPVEVTQFSGDLSLDRVGQWEIEMFGEKTSVYVKPEE